MVHYMPWFQAKPPRRQWGWHWTMNVEQPDTLVKGLPQIASHYHPLIGPYDSDDEAVLECQAQLMKLAGIDGALVDWYGNVDCDDYLPNHVAAQHFISVSERAGLKFGIVYEDRTVLNLIKHGKTTAGSAVGTAGNTLMHWVDRNWFSANPTTLRNWRQADVSGLWAGVLQARGMEWGFRRLGKPTLLFHLGFGAGARGRNVRMAAATGRELGVKARFLLRAFEVRAAPNRPRVSTV